MIIMQLFKHSGRAAAVLLWVLAVIALGFAGSTDLQEAERQQAERCQMVAQWHESNGQYGWPPTGGEHCD